MSATRDNQRAEVGLNYQIFLTDLPRLIVDNRGRYAVYRRQRFVDIFDTFSAAVAYGNQRYTDRLFSVQEIDDEPLAVGGLLYAGDTGDV